MGCPVVDRTPLFGLQLDSQRGPHEVIVIDSAERPTPD
jgi:hypothetical protein